MGDKITRIDELSVTSVDEARDVLAEFPVRVQRIIEIVRDGQIERLPFRIPIRKWDVPGIQSLFCRWTIQRLRSRPNKSLGRFQP